MADIEVKPRDNGPNRIAGPVRVIDLEGNLVREIPEGQTLALCRCGYSKEKPFCDGTHKVIGFQSVIRAASVGPETDAQRAEEV